MYHVQPSQICVYGPDTPHTVSFDVSGCGVSSEESTDHLYQSIPLRMPVVVKAFIKPIAMGLWVTCVICGDIYQHQAQAICSHEALVRLRQLIKGRMEPWLSATDGIKVPAMTDITCAHCGIYTPPLIYASKQAFDFCVPPKERRRLNAHYLVINELQAHVRLWSPSTRALLHAGTDDQMFLSRGMFLLPSRERLQREIHVTHGSEIASHSRLVQTCLRLKELALREETTPTKQNALYHTTQEKTNQIYDLLVNLYHLGHSEGSTYKEKHSLSSALKNPSLSNAISGVAAPLLLRHQRTQGYVPVECIGLPRCLIGKSYEEGDVVLVIRHPFKDFHGVHALRVILHDQHTIHVHSRTWGAMGGDFDGDMAYVLLLAKRDQEAWWQCKRPLAHWTCPHTHRWALGPVEQELYAIFMMWKYQSETFHRIWQAVVSHHAIPLELHQWMTSYTVTSFGKHWSATGPMSTLWQQTWSPETEAWGSMRWSIAIQSFMDAILDQYENTVSLKETQLIWPQGAATMVSMLCQPRSTWRDLIQSTVCKPHALFQMFFPTFYLLDDFSDDEKARLWYALRRDTTLMTAIQTWWQQTSRGATWQEPRVDRDWYVDERCTEHMMGRWTQAQPQRRQSLLWEDAVAESIWRLSRMLHEHIQHICVTDMTVIPETVPFTPVNSTLSVYPVVEHRQWTLAHGGGHVQQYIPGYTQILTSSVTWWDLPPRVWRETIQYLDEVSVVMWCSQIRDAQPVDSPWACVSYIQESRQHIHGWGEAVRSSLWHGLSAMEQMNHLSGARQGQILSRGDYLKQAGTVFHDLIYATCRQADQDTMYVGHASGWYSPRMEEVLKLQRDGKNDQRLAASFQFLHRHVLHAPRRQWEHYLLLQPSISMTELYALKHMPLPHTKGVQWVIERVDSISTSASSSDWTVRIYMRPPENMIRLDAATRKALTSPLTSHVRSQTWRSGIDSVVFFAPTHVHICVRVPSVRLWPRFFRHVTHLPPLFGPWPQHNHSHISAMEYTWSWDTNACWMWPHASIVRRMLQQDMPWLEIVSIEEAVGGYGYELTFQNPTVTVVSNESATSTTTSSTAVQHSWMEWKEDQRMYVRPVRMDQEERAMAKDQVQWKEWYDVWQQVQAMRLSWESSIDLWMRACCHRWLKQVDYGNKHVVRWNVHTATELHSDAQLNVWYRVMNSVYSGQTFHSASMCIHLVMESHEDIQPQYRNLRSHQMQEHPLAWIHTLYAEVKSISHVVAMMPTYILAINEVAASEQGIWYLEEVSRRDYAYAWLRHILDVHAFTKHMREEVYEVWITWLSTLLFPVMESSQDIGYRSLVHYIEDTPDLLFRYMTGTWRMSIQDVSEVMNMQGRQLHPLTALFMGWKDPLNHLRIE
jgi:hypothetical protein